MKFTKSKNNISIEFDDIEISILADSLLDPPSWFETVFNEKIANCKSRLIKRETERFISNKSVANIPTDEEILLELIFRGDDYKNRQDRDLEDADPTE